MTDLSDVASFSVVHLAPLRFISGEISRHGDCNLDIIIRQLGLWFMIGSGGTRGDGSVPGHTCAHGGTWTV